MAASAKKVVLITGASTGLGLEIAQQLIPMNYHLVLTARNSSLERFSKEGIIEEENLWIRELEVTNDNQRRKLISEINNVLGGVDILINNAGISYRSVVEHVNNEERQVQMDVNFLAPMELTRLVLPIMRKKRSGRIINISSVGGMMAMPTMAVYSASKFALEGASESLWAELKPFGIAVTLIQPGFINSEGFTKVKLTNLAEASIHNPNDPYHKHYKYMSSFIAFLMTHSPSNKGSVARTVVKVMHQKNPPLRTAGTIDAYWFSFIRRIMPRRIYHFILYKALPGIRLWGKK